MTNKWLRQEVSELLRLANQLQPEGEPLDLSDREYAMEDMAALRSYLSSQRRSIDLINNALARAWHREYEGGTFDDGTNEWSVGTTKGKRVIDLDLFYQWLSEKDADQLSKLVSGNTIKVTGMTPVERETLLDETSVSDRLSIKSKPTDMVTP